MEAADLLDRIRHCVMPHGVPDGTGTWLRQEGQMRFAPDRPWLRFTAEEWFPGNGIDFRWVARFRMAPLVRVHVIDRFESGKGMLRAVVLGCIPVARAEGPATDRGEALRGLAELPWRPSSFRETALLRWERAGEDRLRASFNDGTTRAEATFQVDGDGHVLGGAVESRPRMIGKSLVETPWSGTFGEYRIFDGIQVPTVAEAIWQLPDGPFPYWRGRVTDFRVLK